ncbi:MAG: LPXTG cell wall anchor domain-containing protein [Deltaproteobacteria bacterium]|nr:MAG: LPXTG cell wall anchor domain-containing protein [Deltaproteobacteria bacterium]
MSRGGIVFIGIVAILLAYLGLRRKKRD